MTKTQQQLIADIARFTAAWRQAPPPLRALVHEMSSADTPTAVAADAFVELVDAEYGEALVDRALALLNQRLSICKRLSQEVFRGVDTGVVMDKPLPSRPNAASRSRSGSWANSRTKPASSTLSAMSKSRCRPSTRQRCGGMRFARPKGRRNLKMHVYELPPIDYWHGWLTESDYLNPHSPDDGLISATGTAIQI